MNTEFLTALEDLAKEKGIDADVLVEAIEAALLSAYKRNFSAKHAARVVVDRESGEYRVFAQRKVVEEVIDPRVEISLEDARKIKIDYELDDIVENEVTPRDFGRIAAQTAKQVVIQRVKEAERALIYEQYSEREGDIINGMITMKDPHGVYIDLGKTEAFLSQKDQLQNESYDVGQRVKAYIYEVKKTSKGPQILVSRTHYGLLCRLLELEVPELQDGVVELKSVAREPGMRSKIAVYSNNENVDPVGACVGTKGIRIQNIVQELSGEKIDVIKWSEDNAHYIASALSPAKVSEVIINEEDKSSVVIVADNQLSLAIGSGGQNARLAARLTGWRIDIKSESQYADEYDQIYNDQYDSENNAAYEQDYQDEFGEEYSGYTDDQYYEDAGGDYYDESGEYYDEDGQLINTDDYNGDEADIDYEEYSDEQNDVMDTDEFVSENSCIEDKDTDR